jgi:Cys-tRNA(Pro)/Cys-tRNA(Cys) deacylase
MSTLKKTNAMRLLDAAKVTYAVRTYDFDESDLSGVHAAEALGMPPETVFKTLVARGDKTGFVVFCIPVAEELDLKKAAKVSGNKAVEMLHVKELLPTTGYIRGGCSPIGMKKPFPTFVDETALLQDRITVSAGVRGAQLLIEVEALLAFIGAKTADLTE